MKVTIIEDKFYLVFEDRAFGWYGYEITHEAYDALRDCEIDDGHEINLDKYTKELDKNV